MCLQTFTKLSFFCRKATIVEFITQSSAEDLWEQLTDHFSVFSARM